MTFCVSEQDGSKMKAVYWPYKQKDGYETTISAFWLFASIRQLSCSQDYFVYFGAR